MLQKSLRSARSSHPQQTREEWENFHSGSRHQQQEYRPIPVMPSQLFQQLAHSQLELLASSLLDRRTGTSKIKSMALYLPQENIKTGQLEFLPVILYPNPNTERVFIASEADSGVAPTLPRTLTKLPGFAHATTLLPGYPMVSTGKEAGVGIVEEVMCDLKSSSGAAALSVPLFSGSQTVGVLLVSPSVAPRNGEQSVWTEQDRGQVARAAQSLSLALSMDAERGALQLQNEQVAEALSDSLHQLKNPLQALRTYGKILQRRIAKTDHVGMTPQLLELAEHLMVQSDRLVDRLKPVDTIVDSLGNRPPLYLNPAGNGQPKNDALTRWQTPLILWDTKTDATSVEDAETSIHLLRNEQPDNNIGQSTSTSRPRDPNMTSSSFLPDMELEMAFVNDVLEPIFSGFQAIALDRDISFVVQESDELPGVTICPQALQEAASNIIDNAFKYVRLPKPGSQIHTNPSPQVRVRLMPNNPKTQAPGVTILVEDNGPGVLPQEREAIFERGVRGTAAQAIDGTGIGLDIARSLIRKMGGTLKLRDNFQGSLNGAVVEIVLFRNPLAI